MAKPQDKKMAEIAKWTPKWMEARIVPSVYGLGAVEAHAKPLYDRYTSIKSSGREPASYAVSFGGGHSSTANQVKVLHTFAKRLVVEGEKVRVVTVHEIARALREREIGEVGFSQVLEWRGSMHLVIVQLHPLILLDSLTQRDSDEVTRWLALHCYEGGRMTVGMSSALDGWLYADQQDELAQLITSYFEGVTVA